MANYTSKLALGLCASALLAGSALAQVEGVPASSSAEERVALPTADAPATAPLSSSAAFVMADTFFYEDFADSLDGWTLVGTEPVDTALWTYVSVDTIPGTFFGDRTISTATVENGFVVANYDFYETNGEGLGPNRIPFDQSIISPSIDLSGAPAGQTLALFFDGYLRYCCTDGANPAQIAFSTDGGTTFENEVLAAPGLAVNANGPGQRYVVIPDEYIGQSDVRIRFRYNGGTFYFWALDDILISQLPPVDLNLDRDFYAVAPSAITPAEQAEGQSIYFVTDVRQLGADTVSADLSVTIERIGDEGRTVIYTDTLAYPNAIRDSLYENRVFPDGFPLPTEAGVYVGTYNLVPADTSARDANLADNSVAFRFEISDDGYYAKGRPSRAGLRFYSQDFRVRQRIGALFPTPNNTADDPVVIDSVQVVFGIDGLSDDDDFTILEVITYGWRGDINGDGAPNVGDSDTSDLVQLGINFLEFEGGTPDFDTVAVLSPDEIAGAVTLPTDQGFIGFAVEMSYTESQAPDSIDNIFLWGADRDFQYGGRQVASSAFDTVGNASTYLSLGINGATFEGYDGTSRPFAIAAFLQTDTTTSSIEELPEAAFAVSPNPAQTELFIDFDETVSNDVVAIQVINALGQQVLTIDEVDAIQGRYNLDVSGLNIGLYYVNVTSADGRSGTKRVMIQR